MTCLSKTVAFTGIALCGLLSLPGSQAMAGDSETLVHTYSDGGRVYKLRLANDEIAIDTKEGVRIEKLQGRKSLSELRRHASDIKSTTKTQVRLVMYEDGVPQNDQTRLLLTGQLRVKLEAGVDARKLAASLGVVSSSELDYAPGYYIFTIGESGEELELSETISRIPGVVASAPLPARNRTAKMVPNDTYFTNQWHLLNSGQNGGTIGVDLHITNVWNNYRGSNIVIGIVDDGVQLTHPDLAVNFRTNIDYNWNSGSLTNASARSSDFHGTAVAGFAGAAKNGVGCVGAAFEATLVSMRLLADPATDADEGAAFAYSNNIIAIKNNSWGISDAGIYIDGPRELAKLALANGVAQGRNGKGTIYVFSGGNGLLNGDNANYDGFANSPYTIAVAAVNRNGGRTWYGESGACLVVAAPGGESDMVTTDLIGTNGYNKDGLNGELPNEDYTATFDGTSAAVPLVSGIAALMLEANPGLGWRDVQEILMRTARLNDPGDPDWAYNPAGFHFNHKYGAGLVDAEAAVQTALTWTNLAARVGSTVITNYNLVIPDNNYDGISCSFVVTNSIRVEHVLVTADVRHTCRGDLTIVMTSPGGMQSVLAEKHGDTNADIIVHTFTSVRDWGENSAGTWKLKIADYAPADTGRVNFVSLQVFGTNAGQNRAPQLRHIGDRVIFAGEHGEFSVIAEDYVDSDAITLSAVGTPIWASFGSLTANKAATNVFSFTPTSTGVFHVVFCAADKDGVSSEAVNLNVIPGPSLAMSESFDGPAVPAAWTVRTNGNAGAYWRFDNPGSRINFTGGSGNMAIADSDHAGPLAMDSELITPLLDFRGYVSAGIRYKSDLRIYSAATAKVDLSTNGLAGPWTTIATESGTPRGPLTRDIDITSQAAGKSNVMIRFHYYDATFDWWWEIDDVAFYGYKPMDIDGDNIPDWWENMFFGSPTNEAAGADYDHDGMINAKEYYAGTVPTNSASVFAMQPLTNTPAGENVISWASTDGRQYWLERSTNLNFAFIMLASNIVATPPVNKYTDSTATNSPIYFYRAGLWY